MLPEITHISIQSMQSDSLNFTQISGFLYAEKKEPHFHYQRRVQALGICPILDSVPQGRKY